MKKGFYPRKNNGKNRELIVYNTIVCGKMLIAKVKMWIEYRCKNALEMSKPPYGSKKHFIMMKNLFQGKKKNGIS